MSDPGQKDPMRYVAPAAFLAAVAFLLWALSASGMLDGGRVADTTSRATTTETTVLSLAGEGETTTSSPATAPTPTTSTPPPAAAPEPNTSTGPTPSTTVAAGGGTYVIKPGDNPVAIAEAHGVSVQDLMALNGITDPTELRVGTTLRIPAAD